MTDMQIPDEAVEAAVKAHRHPRRMLTNTSDGLAHDRMDAALEAALPILHPTIPNTVEALEALPVGSVIQTVDTPLADTGVYTRWSYGWAGAGSYAVPTTSELVAYAEAELSLPGWVVLWPLGGVA